MGLARVCASLDLVSLCLSLFSRRAGPRSPLAWPSSKGLAYSSLPSMADCASFIVV